MKNQHFFLKNDKKNADGEVPAISDPVLAILQSTIGIGLVAAHAFFTKVTGDSIIDCVISQFHQPTFYMGCLGQLLVWDNVFHKPGIFAKIARIPAKIAEKEQSNLNMIMQQAEWELSNIRAEYKIAADDPIVSDVIAIKTNEIQVLLDTKVGRTALLRSARRRTQGAKSERQVQKEKERIAKKIIAGRQR